MDVVLPKNSLTMTEAEIVEWHVTEGDMVQAGEPLFTMETDKSQVEVESPGSGTVLRLLRRIGEVVPAGDVIAVLDTGDGAGNASDGSGRGAPAPARSVSPAAASLAADLGIDVDTVRGSGTGGRVLEEDVIRAAPAEAPVTVAAPAPAPPTGPRTEPVAFSAARTAGMRAAGTVTDVPVFHAAGRLRLAPVWEAMASAGVTVTDVLAACAARALEQVPLANACVRDGAVHRYVDRRVAILARDGDALVPVVLPDPATHPITEVNRARRESMSRIGSGALPADATAWPTFVISNIGRPGVTWFDAVLFPGTAMTLAAGSLGAVEERSVEVVVTCDHRVLDGVDAAGFLAALTDAVSTIDFDGEVAR